jgi:hypothetical protein
MTGKRALAIPISLEECPSECVVCPPCEVCSSLSSRSEEFCESIGFNRNWSEANNEKVKKLFLFLSVMRKVIFIARLVNHMH